MNATQNSVFQAISNPARREIISLLATSSRTVKELTSVFPMSQPAVSQHLRGLREARLVTSERKGSEQRYRLTGEPLRIVYEWSSRYKRFFDPSGHVWAFEQAAGPEPAKKGRAKHGR